MTIDELIVINAAWIRALAGRICPDAEKAADLASETICKTLVARNNYDPSLPFRPWVATIMRNTYARLLRRESCVTMERCEDLSIYPSDVYSDQMAIVGNMLMVIERCASVSVNIPCVMLYAWGYDYAEIARIERIPVGTVRSRISNGRRTLKRSLG